MPERHDAEDLERMAALVDAWAAGQRTTNPLVEAVERDASGLRVEDAVYLRGQVPLDWLDEDELDRVLGSSWQWTEQHFGTVLRLGFASRLRSSNKH